MRDIVKTLLFLMNRTALLVFFVFLSIVGMGWIVFENAPRNVTSLPSTESIGIGERTNEFIVARADKDSDDDGLLDWEEELWGTNPNLKDSDGDGTDDGAEVKANRHPARAAPDDILPKGSAMTLKESIDSYLADENRTETEKIALSLFQGYSNLRQEGTLGGTDTALLVDQLVSKQIALPSEPHYRASELSVVEDTDKTRAAYKRAYDELVAQLANVSENELLTLERALGSESELDIAKLDTPIAVYTDAVRRLLTMPVPEGASDPHLELLNSFALLREGLADMRATLDDPIRGSNGVQIYIASIGPLAASFTDLNKYFERNGLVENTS